MLRSIEEYVLPEAIPHNLVGYPEAGAVPEHRTEDMRILTRNVLPTGQLIRLAFRCGLIEDFHTASRSIQLVMGNVQIELPEREARIFLWGLIRGRERTLAQLESNSSM